MSDDEYEAFQLRVLGKWYTPTPGRSTARRMSDAEYEAFKIRVSGTEPYSKPIQPKPPSSNPTKTTKQSTRRATSKRSMPISASAAVARRPQ
jgi:hypothetical protein